MSGLVPSPRNAANGRKALLYAWACLGLLSLAAVLSPWLADHALLLQLSAAVQSEHAPGSCPLCGMTRAFLHLSRGEWAAAREMNPGSLFLWVVLLLNSAALLLLGLRQLYRFNQKGIRICKPSLYSGES